MLAYSRLVNAAIKTSIAITGDLDVEGKLLPSKSVPAKVKAALNGPPTKVILSTASVGKGDGEDDYYLRDDNGAPIVFPDLPDMREQLEVFVANDVFEVLDLSLMRTYTRHPPPLTDPAPINPRVLTPLPLPPPLCSLLCTVGDAGRTAADLRARFRARFDEAPMAETFGLVMDKVGGMHHFNLFEARAELWDAPHAAADVVEGLMGPTLNATGSVREPASPLFQPYLMQHADVLELLLVVWFAAGPVPCLSAACHLYRCGRALLRLGH